MLRETIRLKSGLVEVEDHGGFLFIREQGTLADVRELQFYTKHLERFIQKTGTKRAVIDAREERGEAPLEIRQAMWAWLESSERGFDKVAFVLPTEMAVARVNMTALSRRASIRAFDNLFEAQRWLVRRRATTVRDLPPANRAPSSRPPPISQRPSSTYHVSSGREERVDTGRASAVPRTRSETTALSQPRSSAPPSSAPRSSVPPGRHVPSDVHRSLRDTVPDDGEEPDGSAGVA